MRHEDGLITCDKCSADITAAHWMCDEIDGEWCPLCFGLCPGTPDHGCGGFDEGCPTFVADLKFASSDEK
jgi:hypothetical protein